MKLREAVVGWDTILREARHQGVEWILQRGGLFGGFHRRQISATHANWCIRHNHVPTQVGRSTSWYESPSAYPL